MFVKLRILKFKGAEKALTTLTNGLRKVIFLSRSPGEAPVAT